MTWEEKFEGLQLLHSDISLRMRVPGNWFVSHVGVEIKDGGILGGVCGNGSIPQEAVEDHWKRMTELKPGQYIVLDAYKDTRHVVKWNGFMWKPVVEEK